MNEKMMEVFVRNIVASLPRNRRKLYQFIEGIEDSLAQQSDTREEFLSLLREHSPHHQAADRFHMSIEETVRFMHDIEDEISEKLENKLKNYKWIDFTEQLYGNQVEKNRSVQYFFVIS
jgi:predicted translin family RNA/ssDNA-binding protein